MMTLLENKFDKYKDGIHLYINIKNIESLVKEDEIDDDMKHIFLLLNTFVVSIEELILSRYKDVVWFEKLTGGRLHLIISKCNQTEKAFF